MNIYFYRNRPPGLFVQPEGFNPDTRESWMPRKEVDTPIGQRAFLGKVEYDRVLSQEEIYEYELWPDNTLEWALYQVWYDLRQGGPDTIYVYVDYAEFMSSDKCDADIADDPTAMVVSILLKSGMTTDDIGGLFQ